MKLQCKRTLLWIGLGCLAATSTSAQQKKAAAPTSALTDAANLCAHPYSNDGYAAGWPEGPVYILFHRKDSARPWVRNPAIQAPGLEAASPATAHTLVCVEETLEEKGKYDTGEKAYQPHWDTTIVSLAGRATYRDVSAPTFDGGEPPEMKSGVGPGIGKTPLQPFLHWLRLLADQKVAHFRMRLTWPLEASGSSDYTGLWSLAISPDGTRLAAARQSRNGSSSPIVVFDLSSGKAVATIRRDYPPTPLAISNGGTWIATAGMLSHEIDILETASGNLLKKLDAPAADSMRFGPDGTLAIAGGGNVVFWKTDSQMPIRTAAGARAFVSPSGAWLLATHNPDAVTVTELESGHQVAAFPGTGWLHEEQYILSQDGTTLAGLSRGDALLYAPGNSSFQKLTLPSILLDSESIQTTAAIASTQNGVVFAGKGFVGIASAADPQPRFFVNGDRYIRNMAESADGKLLVLANIESELYVWELR
jgi:hypothetical protein